MNKPLRVLFIEDSEEDALLVLHKLREGGYDPAYARADTPESVGALLGRQEWDVILCDHSMPRFSVLGALGLLKDKGLDVPLILVSGTIGEEAAVEAMKAGACDFVRKDNLTRLLPAIERELRDFENRKARRRAEEQFLRSQKMEAIARLTGGIAHDFNNLLTVILSYSKFLIDGLDADDPRRRDAQEIQAAGERAAALTRQLLAFSRRQVFQPRTLDLNAAVGAMYNLLRRLIGEDIELVTNLGRDLGRIRGDPGQIEQVIMNLCVNARDAMPNGGKLIIETANAALDSSRSTWQFDVQPGPYVLLSVLDTGEGMSEETLFHIFEPFFTTKEPGKGTGLGLSTVYGIVKQSGGYIWASSEPGKGAAFHVYLPCVDSEEPLPVPVAPPASLRGTENILLVEDEERLLNLSRRALEEQGYRVVGARNGREALDLCGRQPGAIHLVVTDVVMPLMGGTELARHLTSVLPGAKVLYLSGYTEPAVADKGILKPGVNFLQKPFTPDVLARKVREVLDG